MAIESLTMVLPGEPQDVAMEVARQTSTWCHREHGKEVTYSFVDQKTFADNADMPPPVRRALGVSDGRNFLLIEVMANEEWTPDDARNFMGMVSQHAHEVAASIMGLGGDDDGEQWKRACGPDDEE